MDAIDADIGGLIADAVAGAKAAPYPGAETLLTDVYVSY